MILMMDFIRFYKYNHHVKEIMSMPKGAARDSIILRVPLKTWV